MVSQDIPKFMPGDVILCPGKQALPHILTRWATRSHDERPTYAVHTAQFLGPRKVIEMDMFVKKRTTRAFLQMRHAFEVWRYSPLTLAQRQAISSKSIEYLGREFGWKKMFTHMLDSLINKVSHRQVFFFRRLNHDQRYPICSWITAFSYDRAVHYRFGVPPECADPDQISDWIHAHPGEWIRVYRLEERPRLPIPLHATPGRARRDARIRGLALRGG